LPPPSRNQLAYSDNIGNAFILVLARHRAPDGLVTPTAAPVRQDGNVTNLNSSETDNEPHLVVVQAGRSPSPSADEVTEGENDKETLVKPGKVMRIGSMIRQLLEEVRQAPLDEASRARLREIYDTSLRELQEGLSPDLSAELARMAPPFHPESVPTDAELRVAQAQLVGWLEGVFHGLQATLFAQQMAERARLEEAQRRGLPAAAAEERTMPGTYL
jgi:hypothetical protein